MNHSRKILIPIFGITLIALVTGWYLLGAGQTGAAGPLAASGTVEAVEVLIGPEMVGRVVEVPVEKGQVVAAGEILFRLDDELLQGQRQRAEAALQSAQVGLRAAEAGLQAAEASLQAAETGARLAETGAQAELVPLENSLDELNEKVGVARAAAEAAVAAANRAVREATYRLDNYTVPTAQQKLTAQEAVLSTKAALDEARAAYEPYKYESSSNSTRQDRKKKLDEAQSDYDSAVRRLEYEAAVGQAQAALEQSLRDLQALQDGPDPDQVSILNARIAAVRAAPEQAQAAVAVAEAGVAQAQARLEQARAAIEQAQTELNLIELQLRKTTVFAPSGGIILNRNIEPGEMVQPGSAALVLGELDNLTITVYIPEDRYGMIELGMAAQVRVDSFSGQTFAAQVTYIARQAEFTPRNVQTAEGRRTTVFAVQLQVDDPQGRLKPGMPADVTFGQ